MPDGTKEHAKLSSQSKENNEFPQLADIKDSLDEIHRKLDDIDKCRTEIQNLSQLVCQLKEQNEMKDKTIQDLEKRVEDLEQYTHQDDFIVSGLKTSHKSYAPAVHSDDVLDSQDAPQDELASLEHQVSSFIEKRWVLHLGNRTLVLDIHYQAKKPYQIL